MKMQNFKRDIDYRLFYGLIIVMALLLNVIANDARGSGPGCSPCDSYDFDGYTGGWRCMGCIADCGTCYSCDTSNPNNPSCKKKFDSRTQSSCCDCRSICNGNDCKSCAFDGSGTCQSNCDPNKCQTCDGNGTCPVCGGDPNKACCNGTCYDKKTQQCCDDISPHYPCDINSTCCYGHCCGPNQWCCNVDQTCHDECVNSEPSHHCDTTHDDDPENICPGCTGGILETHCMDITFRVYTGNENYNCSGGCPGECARHDVICYTEYKCREEVMQFGVCGVVAGAPGGVACQDAGTYLWCIPCHKDTDFPGEDIPVVNRECGY